MSFLGVAETAVSLTGFVIRLTYVFDVLYYGIFKNTRRQRGSEI